MDNINHEARITKWKAIIEQSQYRLSGQTLKQQLVEHPISEKSH